jgi:hypothetical protein
MAKKTKPRPLHELNFQFKAKLWLYGGNGSWHFVTVPESMGSEIRFFTPAATGFMPVPVKARIGNTSWQTSVFPDKKSKSYLLAVKADVRKREKLSADDEVEVFLRVD